MKSLVNWRVKRNRAKKLNIFGFGSGVGIQRLAGLASIGYIAGIDSSKEMVEQATARNLKKIEAGLVDLRSQDNNKSLQEKLPRHEFTYC